MVRKQVAFSLFAGLVLAVAAVANAAQPVGWRSDTTGLFAVSSPPQQWGKEEHVAWKVKLPGHSNGSPTVVGDKVLVCAEPDKLLCFNAADGELLWQVASSYDKVLDDDQKAQAKLDDEKWQAIRKQIDALHKQIEELEKKRKDAPDDAELKDQRQGLDKQVEALRKQQEPLSTFRVPEKSAGCSTATPLVDGDRVYVLYGTGIAACYDLEGDQQWIKLFDKPNTDWGHTASPLVIGDTLVVHFTDLVALDKQTGKERWSQELKSSYGSPVSCNVGGAAVIVTAAGDVVRAGDGEVLAEKIAEPLTRCSPVASGNVVYFVQAKAQAVRLEAGSGGKIEAKLLWTTNMANENYFSSPLVKDDLLYAVSENRQLTVLDVAEGEVVYQERLKFKKRGACVSSLAAAGGLVFIMNEEGNTKVIRAGRDYQEVAENELGHLRSSPVFAEGRLFVRTSEHLISIGD